MQRSQNKTLIAHLEALRQVLIKCLSALGVCFLPCFFVAPYVIDGLCCFIKEKTDISLNFFAPMEVFILQIKIALILDVLLCFPYMAKKIWYFILPGLYVHERKFIRLLAISSSLLFIAGVLFCVFFVLPLIMQFALSFETQDLKPMFGIAHIVSLCLGLSIVFGVIFEFPLITYALICSKITSYQSISKKRPYVFLSILILSAFFTPPDIVSQILLAVPSYVLFELGLFFARSK